jgi:hypothetical protein
MASHAIAAKATRTAMPSVWRFGFWTALIMSVLTVVTFAIALATPPRSGPFCTMSSCVIAPYTDVAVFFPRDYVWMYSALLLTAVFVVFMVCIHHYASDDKKLFSLIGLSFAVMSAALIMIDYFIQLTVIQPSLLQGEADGLSLISQYNPHGIFIALEALGYLLMSVALLFAAPVFAGHDWVERTLHWLFIASCTLAMGSLIILSLLYGHDLEYRFEVAVISIDWLVLIISGILVSVVFNRTRRDEKS